MNELNLYEFFNQIVSKSKTMKRFVVADGYGNDLNTNNVGEILADVIGGISDGKKYPLVIMFPPVEIPNYDTNWSKFKCKMYFLNTQSNDVGSFNKNNNLSTNKIKEILNTMSGCAKDFRKVFQEVTERNLQKGIRDGQSFDIIDRVSNVGNDKSAGVGISFDIELNSGCEIQDYTNEDIANLIQSFNDN